MHACYLRTANARKSTFCTFSLGLLYQQAGCLHKSSSMSTCTFSNTAFQASSTPSAGGRWSALLSAARWAKYSPRTPNTEKPSFCSHEIRRVWFHTWAARVKYWAEPHGFSPTWWYRLHISGSSTNPGIRVTPNLPFFAVKVGLRPTSCLPPQQCQKQWRIYWPIYNGSTVTVCQTRITMVRPNLHVDFYFSPFLKLSWQL